VPRPFARQTNFLSRLREVMGRLPRAERGVAQAILDDPDGVLSLSISELAARSGVGDATVVRMARRCGLSGFQELKILVAADRSATEGPERDPSPAGLDEEVGRVMAAQAASLAATRHLLDLADVERTAEHLDNARRVAVYGVGTSALAARYLAYRLIRMGVAASFEEDAHYQAMGTVLMGREDVAVAFSQSGSTYSVVGALEACRAAGAFTAAVTRSRSAPLTTAADVILLTGADETPLLSGALPGLASQLFLADILAIATGVRRPDRAREALRQSAERVATMKF
jgi:DNA-binding MurR/RpiR family transcriptional regulator